MQNQRFSIHSLTGFGISHATLHQKLLEDQKVHLEQLNSIYHQKTDLKNSFFSKKSSVESELHLIKKDIRDLKLKRKISKQQKAASKSEPPSNCFWSCSTGRPGKAVDLVPVISGVGGVAEAIVVYENGRRKQKRARNVFRTMGNAFRMHQIARKICLRVSNHSIETISTMSRKEITAFGFKAAKAVQRIISGSSGSESDRLSTSELAEQIFETYLQILATRK